MTEEKNQYKKGEPKNVYEIYKRYPQVSGI
jgi:hypothetical protein